MKDSLIYVIPKPWSTMAWNTLYPDSAFGMEWRQLHISPSSVVDFVRAKGTAGSLKWNYPTSFFYYFLLRWLRGRTPAALRNIYKQAYATMLWHGSCMVYIWLLSLFYFLEVLLCITYQINKTKKYLTTELFALFNGNTTKVYFF